MHLKPCSPPLGAIKLEEMDPLTMRDGSVVQAMEAPATCEYFERVTSKDGSVRWYRVVTDGVVSL